MRQDILEEKLFMRDVVSLLFAMAVFIFPVRADDVISGTVTDSVTSAALDSVKVKATAQACSTFTDTDGNFTLTFYSTIIKPLFVQKPEPKIFWNPADGIISFSGYSGTIQLELIDIRGKSPLLRMAPGVGGVGYVKGSLSPGIYFARVKAGNRTDVYKIANINSGPAAISRVSGSASYKGMDKGGLAKTSTTYDLTFEKTGYDTASRSVSGSISGLLVKLSPIDQTGGVQANVTVQQVGTTTIEGTIPDH